MKRSVALLFAAAIQGAALGAFFLPAHAQAEDPSSVAVPEPDAGMAADEPDESQAPAALTPSSPAPDTVTLAPAKKTQAAHTHHRKKKHARRRGGAGNYAGSGRVRVAQIDLAELGYRPGPSDGVMGPGTKAALKAFQRDHRLHADGVLGPMTYNALIREAGSKNPTRGSPPPTADFYTTHPDYYGYFGPDYANPSSFGSPQAIPVRFGTLALAAQQTGQTYHFDLMLNGRSIFHADNQPTPINVSRTFSLNNADAIVLTSYAAGNNVCPYRHYVLVVRPNSNGLHPIDDCTRDYEAYTENGMLYISFPGPHVDGWSSGATWRYDNGALEKL